MTDEEIKYNIYREAWDFFKEFEDILIASGVPINRLPREDKMLEALEDIPLNKMRHGMNWIKSFKKLCIDAYTKIRAENSEEYWENAKALGWGNEYTEIRELGLAAKKIRTDWFTSHNPLIPPKKIKVKKEKKDDKPR